MSEEFESWKTKVFKLDERISELEKTLAGTDEDWTLFFEWKQKIEKDLNELTDCDHGTLQHFEKLIRTSQKEIAELRSEIEYIKTFVIGDSKQNYEQLYELKELNKRNWDRILTFEDYCDTWSPARKCKKLDGAGSARQTDIGFDGFLGSNEARKEHLNKDSGGDLVKEVKKEYEKGLKEGKWIEYPPRQDDKPPEPKCDCYICNPNDNSKLRTYIDGVDITDFNPVAEVLGINPCQKLISEFVKDLKGLSIIVEIEDIKLVNHLIKKWEDKLNGGEK